MRMKKWSLLVIALLASASVTLSSTPASNTNRRPKPKRPSSAIGAGGAGTYAKGARRKAPTAPPTPRASNSNAPLTGGDAGAGVQPHDPVNANGNANGNTAFVGTADDGVGVRRKAPPKRRQP
jgi:hypothetical protein